MSWCEESFRRHSATKVKVLIALVSCLVALLVWRVTAADRGEVLESQDGRLRLRVTTTSMLDTYYRYYVSAPAVGSGEYYVGCLSNDDPAMMPESVRWIGDSLEFTVHSGLRRVVEFDPATGGPVGEYDRAFLSCPGYGSQ